MHGKAGVAYLLENHGYGLHRTIGVVTIGFDSEVQRSNVKQDVGLDLRRTEQSDGGRMAVEPEIDYAGKPVNSELPERLCLSATFTNLTLL